MAPKRTAAPARVVLLLAAIGVVGFLVIGLRAAVPQAEGRELTSNGRLDEVSYRRALELFRDAQRLNPDTDPELLEAGLLLIGGSPRAAASALERVAATEPDNSKAWALLAAATATVDPERAREARIELRRVKPPVRAPG